jgi:hypothetical protein
MTLSALVTYRWHDESDAPVIAHPRFSPILADPAVVPPEAAPDGLWHLYAHSAWGLHEYRSTDGRSWRDRGILFRRAMRPWVFFDGGWWHLAYERPLVLGLAATVVPGLQWRSRIEMRSSVDLVHWGPARTLLEPSLEWNRSPGLGAAVSCPCLVKSNGRYRLYYSAGLVRVPDCGFNEPRFIGLAEADTVEGPYISLPDPILSPGADTPFANLSRGSLRVVRMEDGWAGFENGISFDTGVSTSALFLLRSQDGKCWETASAQPLVSPEAGWKGSHVYAGCPVARENGDVFLYYNARDDWPLARGRENIGLAVGRPSEANA